PTAAALAGGTAEPENVGPLIGKIELLADLHPRQIKPGQWQGRLLSIDRFGNCITNFSVAAFSKLPSSRFSLRVGTRRITAFHPTFGNARSRMCFAYFGSSGYIELGMKEQSAAAFLKAQSGDIL